MVKKKTIPPRQATPRTKNSAHHNRTTDGNNGDTNHSLPAAKTSLGSESKPSDKGRITFAVGRVGAEGNSTNIVSTIEDEKVMYNPQDAELRNTSDDDSPTISSLDEVRSGTKGNTCSTPKGISKKVGRRDRRASQRASAASGDSTTASSDTRWKRRKRGRTVRLVSVHESSSPKAKFVGTSSFPPLPGNQYSTVLRRRAIRKLDDLPDPRSFHTEEKNTEEVYGDISLGMKLIVVGGRVIVQTLNALVDGRASPAQLVGVVQRGDVLLAIGNSSLVNLPIDQLMNGLQPLSSPETTDGRYTRILRLRLEAGVGHDLLQSHEEDLKRPTLNAGAFLGGQDAANDMFAFFPMVDQLSGAPLFEPSLPPANEDDVESPDEVLPETAQTTQPENLDLQRSVSRDDATEVEVTPDELISALLAKEQGRDRERFASEYFNWNDTFCDLLKQKLDTNSDEAAGVGLTKTERVDMGRKVMKLAKTLTYNMEDIDKGKDLRSFKTWSTNFSLRSGASARRRHIMDAVSLRSHRPFDADEAPMDDSIGSAGSVSFGSVDGDALLLGLAAHDGIWRKQVVDALKSFIENMENGVDRDENAEAERDEETHPGDIDAALSNQFGAFLFGENMNSIVKKKKKSHALPPNDITTVLFDLATHIATAAPDEATLFGGTANSFSYQSSFGTQGKAKARLRADTMLANQFILDEALPVWLDSFRPLGLEHRRLFWPRDRHGSTASDNDSLTVDSTGTAPKSPSRAKNLQETIEDLELDVETRAETCFLVTYYFSQQLLSRYSGYGTARGASHLDSELKSFIQKFGTYLQIHSCLSFAASVEADLAVQELLKVASHDPSHREAVKEIQKANNLTFFDVSKLSAVLQFLRGVRFEFTEQRRKVIRSLIVSAYPDILPWQVKSACLDPECTDNENGDSCSDECLRDFYYSYLSLLLDPVVGHESARHNTKLIKEWCEWSIGTNAEGTTEKAYSQRKQNFYRVASRTSSAHLAYRRDLPVLLEMSMSVHEHDLALELAGEIIENKKVASKEKIIRRVLICLRVIGTKGLSMAFESEGENYGFHTFKRVLRAIHQMSTSVSKSCRRSIVVHDELLAFLEGWGDKVEQDAMSSKMFVIIDIMIDESEPRDVLSALVRWSCSNDLGPALFLRLDSLLKRGVQVALKSELSGSLLRLKQMRQGYTDNNVPLMGTVGQKDGTDPVDGIWKRMSVGSLSIDK